MTRDYAFLDTIHPARIKTAEQWLRREDERSRAAGKGGLWERLQPDSPHKHPPILKVSEDRRRGKL